VYPYGAFDIENPTNDNVSKESLEFPALVCLNKHQYDFCFVLNFEFSKLLVNI